MENINIYNETWIFDAEIKRLYVLENSGIGKNEKKARMSRSKFKTMLIVFSDINGTVMTERVTQRIKL